MIKIIDIKVGNVMSVKNAFKKIEIDTEIISSTKDIDGVKGIILPGIGSFDAIMSKLESDGWVNTLNYYVLKKKIPVLGICLGMQIMANSSEEGSLPGFGWIDAEVKKIIKPNDLDEDLPLPHMGWSRIKVSKSDLLFPDLKEEMRFYFVHGYHVVCNKNENLISKTFYGSWLTASISHANIYGVQFHPEKSHKFGQKVLKRFSEICI